jgi:hypothetical protein
MRLSFFKIFHQGLNASSADVIISQIVLMIIVFWRSRSEGSVKPPSHHDIPGTPTGVPRKFSQDAISPPSQDGFQVGTHHPVVDAW